MTVTMPDVAMTGNPLVDINGHHHGHGYASKGYSHSHRPLALFLAMSHMWREQSDLPILHNISPLRGQPPHAPKELHFAK